MHKVRLERNSKFYEKSSRVLTAMANARRVAILTLLAESEDLSVGHLAKKLEISQSALSQHLAKLRLAGLIQSRREAQQMFYSIASKDVVSILKILDESDQTVKSNAA